MAKKKRIFFRLLESCWNCPALGVDQNGTRWECKNMNSRFICWHGSSKEDKDYFPDWCPLDEHEEFTEDDFNVD